MNFVPSEKCLFFFPPVIRLLKKSVKKNTRATFYSYGCMSIIHSMNLFLRTKSVFLDIFINDQYVEHQKPYLDLEEKLEYPSFCVNVLYESAKGNNFCCNYLVKLNERYYIYFKNMITYTRSPTLMKCPMCEEVVRVSDQIETHLIKAHSNVHVICICVLCLLTNVYENIPLRYIIASTIKGQKQISTIKKLRISEDGSFKQKVLCHVRGFHFYLTNGSQYIDSPKTVLKTVVSKCDTKLIHKIDENTKYFIPKCVLTGSSKNVILPWLTGCTKGLGTVINELTASVHDVPDICKMKFKRTEDYYNEEEGVVDVRGCFGVTCLNKPTSIITSPEQQLIVELDYDTYKHLNLLKYNFYMK